MSYLAKRKFSKQFFIHSVKNIRTCVLCNWLGQLHISLLCCNKIRLNSCICLVFFNFQIEMYTWINHVHRYHTYTKVASQHTFNPIFLLIVYTEIKAFEILQYPSHLHKRICTMYSTRTRVYVNASNINCNCWYVWNVHVPDIQLPTIEWIFCIICSFRRNPFNSSSCSHWVTSNTVENS